MKVTDLMIGDYVRLAADNEKEVLQVNYVRRDGVGFEKYAVYFDEVEPIQLTAKILKKNFFYDDCGRYEIGEHIEGKKGQLDAGECGYLIPRLDGIIECTIYTHIANMSVNIKYVHELQHALRLCGLKELVDNFSI